MQHIDQDTITQAVIARHTTAGDTRVREVMTSLVQHLHAFAREARLTEAEWAEGVRFLGECGRSGNAGHQELVLLSDALGLSTLVFSGYTRDELAGHALGPAVLAHLDVLVDGRYRAGERLGQGLRGSANQQLHLLTARHRADELAAVPTAEVRIAPDGTVTLTGVDPLKAGALR